MPRCPTRSRWAQSLFWSWVPWPAARASGRNRLMKLFYGWVIVGAGIVVTCIGVGAMLSLAIFLQPMSEAMGWSRTGISTAALLNWLCMGVGSFLWGALSDRFGTRAVVLLGGVLLGLGLGTASQAARLGQFQLVFGVVVGLAAGSFYTPMTGATRPASSRSRRRSARRSSLPSRSRTSRVALHTRARSSTWSPTRSIAACRRWPPPPCSASQAWPP